MNAFSAHWFDGLTSRMHAVTVTRLDADRIRVQGDSIDREATISDLRITARLARTARTIEFPGGARLLVADHPLLDSWFPSEDRLQRFVDRLERHAHAVAASIIFCLVAAIVTFTWGVPWMADRIAAQIPQGVEAQLGSEVMQQLDSLFGLKPSEIESYRQEAMRERFSSLAAELPGAARYRLEFRSAPSLGANALAIPGGVVVVTDELIDLFDDERELDAVLAHELGHQEHRHALRQTLRGSFVLVIATLFTGDVSSASAIVIAVPTMLLQNHYSRSFEEEADSFAFEMLAKHKISPAWFGSAISKLTGHEDDSDDDLGYLSSHPSNVARIAAAQAAGVAFLVMHPDLARETPDYVACAEEGECPEEDDYGEECEDIDCDEAEHIDDESMTSEFIKSN